MSKACLIAVLISLLFTLQARAAHECVLHGHGAGAPVSADTTHEISSTPGSLLLDAGAGHIEGAAPDSHGSGHCDLCSHASLSAVGPQLPALIVHGELSERVALGTSRAPVNPPLSRPDKPPR